MRISDLLQNKKPLLSCEIFPPKLGTELTRAFEIAQSIALLKPAFISVTCGAGAHSAANKAGYTEEISVCIEKKGVPALAHLTCVATPKNEIDAILNSYADKGIENILALRGDLADNSSLPKGEKKPEANCFTYANELVSAIKKKGGFCIGAACYPEGHVESANQNEDLNNLKIKVDAGCDFLTTQMFFDNNILYKFLYKLSQKNITVPVIAGIMPVTNKTQIKRILELSGTVLPSRFANIIDKFGDNPAAMKQAGIAYATEQIIDLIANDVRGIHIYTMNKPDVAQCIMRNLSEILSTDYADYTN